MVQNFYIITKRDLFDLFGRLSDTWRVIVPYSKGEKLYFDRFDPQREDLIEPGGIRQSQPVKSFMNPPRERVLGGPQKAERPLILAGVKGCDLSSFVLQDFVFLKGDPPDPFYSEKRKNTLIISCDCTYARETCFCSAMDGAPYPRDNFDINLSYIDTDFLVEAATDKARDLIASYRVFFKDASGRHLGIRKDNRDRVTEQVRGFIAKRGTQDTSKIRGVVMKNYNLTRLWQDFASTCVECGACNLVCPTCHCFLLCDERSTPRQKLGVDAEPVEASKHDFKARYRQWDACLYNTFARVAGGANPRKHLYERLRNRFEKKFDFFPKVLDASTSLGIDPEPGRRVGYFACTGCGRCIEACPGDIDIREVLKGLVLGKWNKPPND